MARNFKLLLKISSDASFIPEWPWNREAVSQPLSSSQEVSYLRFKITSPSFQPLLFLLFDDQHLGIVLLLCFVEIKLCFKFENKHCLNKYLLKIRLTGLKAAWELSRKPLEIPLGKVPTPAHMNQLRMGHSWSAWLYERFWIVSL